MKINEVNELLPSDFDSEECLQIKQIIKRINDFNIR